MHVVELLKTGVCQDVILDAAADSDYGGLIPAGDLSIMLKQEHEEGGEILRLIMDALPPDAIVAKSYVKGNQIKIIGLNVCAKDGELNICGAPIPKKIKVTKTKESRGSGERAFVAPIARLLLTVGEEVITLDFDFQKPAAAEDYKAWCNMVVATSKEGLPTVIGEWSEPSVSAGGGARTALTAFPQGTYRIVAIESETAIARSGNPYTKWSMTTDCGLKTWPMIMPQSMRLGAVQERMLAKGKHLFMEINGLKDQTNADGIAVINPKTGTPYQEVLGRIWSEDPGSSKAEAPAAVSAIEDDEDCPADSF